MANRASISTWLIRFIIWGGLLPAIVWSVPFLVASLFPNRRGAVELAAVILPIVAAIFRYRFGRQYIASNVCGAAMRRCQVAVLCMGVFVMVPIDAVMALSHVMPEGAESASTTIWAVLFAIYLMSIAIAMYPGCFRPPDMLDSLESHWSVSEVDRFPYDKVGTTASERKDAARPNHPPVSTLALFGYLVTILAWELEIGVVLLHILAKEKLDPIGHSAMLGVLLALTAFTFVRGKRDFVRLRGTRGRVQLTSPQVVWITLFAVCLGAIFSMVTMRLVHH